MSKTTIYIYIQQAKIMRLKTLNYGQNVKGFIKRSKPGVEVSNG